MLRIPPLYAIAVAVAIGDAIGNLHFVVPFWIALAASVIALAAFVTSRRTTGVAAAYLAIALLAACAVDRVLDPPRAQHTIRNFVDGSPITIEGMLYREPEREPYGIRLYVAIERAAKQSDMLAAASGTVRIAVIDGGKFRLGDEVRLSAKIRFPRNYGNPGEFDYAAMMARDGIDATMSAHAKMLGTPVFRIIGNRPRFPATQIESIRNHIGEFIDRNLAYPQSAEMRALVIGDRGEIDQHLRDTFARTGMAHLLVISGLHLSLVAATTFAVVRLAMMLLPGLASRGYANKVAALGAMFTVCAYASIAGHHVSTMRALVMVLAYMLAVMIDRSREALASLALAALIICFALPGSTADIGFQLSFASVIAIVIGMRRFQAWFARRKRLGRLPGEQPSRAWKMAEGPLGYLAVSFWAMLGTAPLTAFHFNQFAIVGVLANAIVVPIMAFGATISGLLASALSFVSEPLARPVLLFAGGSLQLGNLLAGWFVELSMAWMRTFTPTALELAISYALIALWLLSPKAAMGDLQAKKSRWRASCASVLVVAIFADAGWWTYDRFFNPDLRVTFLSVGQGDGAVVRFPGSRVMLIDAGGSYAGFDAGERIVAPYLWSRKIMQVDYLVLTHPDADHFGGMSFVAMNFSPDAFWTIPIDGIDLSYRHLIDALDQAKIPIVLVRNTAPIAKIGGVSLSSLNSNSELSTKLNNSSMVLRFAFGDISFLFTGDLEAGGERALLASGQALRSTVLKVPHHGSKSSSTAQFVAHVHPQVAVISDGYLNRFHFPAAEVVDRYLGSGATLLRTDSDGAVTIDATREGAHLETWDGPSMRIVPPDRAGIRR